MRIQLYFALLLGLFATHATAQDSSPLARAPATVAPCLQACEKDFVFCESQPQVTAALCPQSRRICFERCDPAVLSSETLKGLKRTPEELRNQPLNPQTPHEQCRQSCQDRRATCLEKNRDAACEPATEACYARCDKKTGKPKR